MRAKSRIFQACMMIFQQVNEYAHSISDIELLARSWLWKCCIFL